jgi:hypothetical protein
VPWKSPENKAFREARFASQGFGGRKGEEGFGGG